MSNGRIGYFLQFAALIFTPICQGAILYYNGFEDGVGPRKFVNECRPTQFNLVDGPARSGHHALRIHQRGPDQCVERDGDLSGRSEMVWGADFASTLLANKWGWIGWSVHVPADFPLPEPDGKGFYMMQTHGGGGGGGVGGFGWRMLIKSERFELQRTFDRNKYEIVWSGSMVRGQWHDFVIKQFLSAGPDGRVSLWHNGVKVVNDYRGANYGGTGRGVFVKSGIYWGKGTRTQDYTLYLDELRIGDEQSSYDEVKPRGGKDLPALSIDVGGEESIYRNNSATRQDSPLAMAGGQSKKTLK